MTKATTAMHPRISRAVVILRKHLRLGQQEFSDALVRLTGCHPPGQEQISRWERGAALPTPAFRAELAALAEENDLVDLAEILRAPTKAWRLVAVVDSFDATEEEVTTVFGPRRQKHSGKRSRTS